MMSRKDRHKQKKLAKKAPGKRRFWQRKGFQWTVGILALLIGALLAYYVYYINSFIDEINEPKDPSFKKVETEEWKGTDPVNILVMGVDNRDDDEHPRSDSMLLVSIDPLTKKARVMSVMRDTWYKIPDGYGFEKINASHALGGPDLTIRTLKDMLQIPIHYYVKTDFQGFISVVDALGGVTIDVEKDLDYVDDGQYDIHLKQGVQRLDGEHALMYVRFRHDAMSDFARTERQRKFLAAVSDEMKSGTTLFKLPKILDSISPYIETNIQGSDLIKLGKLALEIDSSNIDTLQVPPMNTFREGFAGGGQSVLIPNVFEMRKAVYEFLGKDVSLIEEDPSDQPQEYYNPEPTPTLPDNPNVEPDEPEPPVTDGEGTEGTNQGDGQGDGTGAGGTGTGTDGTGTDGTGTGGTGADGTGTGGTGTGGTGTGDTGTGGTGTGGTGTNGTGTGGTSTGGTSTGGTSTDGTGTGGTSTGGTNTGGTNTGGTSTGGTSTGGTSTGGTTTGGATTTTTGGSTSGGGSTTSGQTSTSSSKSGSSAPTKQSSTTTTSTNPTTTSH
ncbi:MAG TPA: LCP family protein [Bacilli bacterium]|nr:LCP family protein [Bacilli bacterium]